MKCTHVFKTGLCIDPNYGEPVGIRYMVPNKRMLKHPNIQLVSCWKCIKCGESRTLDEFNGPSK